MCMYLIVPFACIITVVFIIIIIIMIIIIWIWILLVGGSSSKLVHLSLSKCIRNMMFLNHHFYARQNSAIALNVTYKKCVHAL